MTATDKRTLDQKMLPFPSFITTIGIKMRFWCLNGFTIESLIPWTYSVGRSRSIIVRDATFAVEAMCRMICRYDPNEAPAARKVLNDWRDRLEQLK